MLTHLKHQKARADALRNGRETRCYPRYARNATSIRVRVSLRTLQHARTHFESVAKCAWKPPTRRRGAHAV
eukprot:11035222-Lingulodinium_polyedra.AAC.1